jgi:hypothetical protein
MREPTQNNQAHDSRAEQLHRLARAYVLEGLGQGNFNSIPYADNVSLRAPLCAGGSAVPLIGKANLLEKWWAPLPPQVAGVEVVETFVNQDLTVVAVEFRCRIRHPACTLRVIDRFTIDPAGWIVEQENFFDPRDLTNPGWQSQ